ncbi:MAG: hypothetical protein L3J24_04725 [Xanthomonadales bacterium]|nr:hypothetical protein [Xanthomonadales bacterium]
MSQERDIYFRTADMLINSNTGEVSNQKQKLRLSPVNSRVLNLIDAKTALVIYSQQHPFKQVDELKAHCNEFVTFVSQL